MPLWLQCLLPAAIFGAVAWIAADSEAYRDWFKQISMNPPTAAFLAAFITNDSDKLYQSALDAVDSTESALSRVRKRYERMVARIARKYGPRLGIVAAAYGTHNAKVVELKRNRGIASSEDDNLDLTTLDRMLVEARNEIGQRTRHGGSRSPAPEDDTQTVSPFPGRRT